MKSMSLKNLQLVTELYQICQERKKLDKLEKELKTKVKEIMSEDNILDVGPYLVVISQRSRTDIDKDGLMHDLGLETLRKYLKFTSYDVLEVKATSREVMNG